MLILFFKIYDTLFLRRLTGADISAIFNDLDDRQRRFQGHAIIQHSVSQNDKID